MENQIASSGEKFAILKQSPVFSSLPEENLHLLAEMMESESFSAESYICQYGDPASRVFVLAQGSIEVILPGRKEPVRILGTGAVMGEYGMFSSSGRTSSLKAREDSLLLSLDYTRFKTFLHEFPEAMFALFETAVKRLIEAERR